MAVTNRPPFDLIGRYTGPVLHPVAQQGIAWVRMPCK